MGTQEDYLAYLNIKKLRDLKEFPLVKGIEDKRLRRIYPLMQKSVQQVLDLLSEYPVTVIVFGSALSMKCNITSDLDLCIKTTVYDKEWFHFLADKLACNMETKLDILYYNDLTEKDRIKEEIDRFGYIIQEAF